VALCFRDSFVKKLIVIISTILLLFSLTTASYLYGVSIGSELKEANTNANEASKLVYTQLWPDTLHEVTASQREAKINKSIISFGKFLSNQRPSPFLDDTVKTTLGLFLEAAQYRLDNPDKAKFDKTLKPYSNEAISRIEEAISKGELNEKILKEYIDDSYYYHLALKYAAS
jgi:hypothetical protein